MKFGGYMMFLKSSEFDRVVSENNTLRDKLFIARKALSEVKRNSPNIYSNKIIDKALNKIEELK